MQSYHALAALAKKSSYYSLYTHYNELFFDNLWLFYGFKGHKTSVKKLKLLWRKSTGIK
jgi:hypothetical protein